MVEYIEREALLGKISRMIDYCEKDKPVNGLTALFQVGDAIIDCKAADVAPVVHGRWIEGGYVCGETEWECSVCNETEWRASMARLKYCPFCGAKMDLEE